MKFQKRTPAKGTAVATAFSGSQLAEKVFFLCLFTIPTGYGISARTVDDYINHATSIAVISFLMSAAWLVSTRVRIDFEHGGPYTLKQLYKNPLGLSWRHFLIFHALSACLAIMLGVVLYSVVASAFDLYGWVVNLNPLVHKSQSMGIAGIVVLALGGIFFWARLKARFTYGFVEASAGIAFAVYRFSLETKIALPADNGFYFAMLTAGVYLVVRGFDNMYQGWMEAKDPIVSILLSAGSNPLLRKPPRRLRPNGAHLVGAKTRRWRTNSFK